MRFRAFPAGLLALAAVVWCVVAVIHAQAPTLVPGTRVLLDAHNAYPYEGRHTDRIHRAMATGLPVAIEQDLIWRAGANGTGASVVGHDLDKVADAPTLESYFFGTLGPVMAKALEENRRDRWPLVVLNLDFKTNEPEHHAAVLRALAAHEAWLTTGQRTATPETPGPLKLGPLLVLTGSNPAQQTAFHDRLTVGDTMYLFGAYEAPPPPGETPEARAVALATAPVDALLPRGATNYRRWANFPWHVVEKGGQPHAGPWDAADRTRLDALVSRAHAQGLWIRFYTLNGHAAADAEANGWSKGYNFGSLANAAIRWKAAREATVDFIATDQYEEFHRALNPGR